MQQMKQAFLIEKKCIKNLPWILPLVVPGFDVGCCEVILEFGLLHVQDVVEKLMEGRLIVRLEEC